MSDDFIDEDDSIDEEQYITDENDTEKVLIVPDDDHITNDGEVKIDDDEIVSSPKSTIINLDKHDSIRVQAVLDSLRKGEFRK